MRKTIGILLFALLLASGCNRQDSSSRLLSEIDERLASDYPDSAYGLLSGMNVEEMTECDKAYRTLLLLQTALVSENTPPADSLVEAAEGFYEAGAGGDASHSRMYQRILIEKGNLSAQRKEGAKAMQYVLKADSLAEKSDLQMQATINIAKGNVFHKLSGKFDLYAGYYKTAFDIYGKIGRKKQQGMIANFLGGNYSSESKLDSAYKYLKTGLEIAREINDSDVYLNNMVYTSGYHWVKGEHPQAKDAGLEVIKSPRKIKDRKNAFYAVIASYIKLGKVDSALYYKSMMGIDTTNQRDRVFEMSIRKHLAVSDSDYKTAYRYEHLIFDSVNAIIHNDRIEGAKAVIDAYEAPEADRSDANILTTTAVGVMAVILFVLFILVVRKRKKANSSAEEEAKNAPLSEPDTSEEQEKYPDDINVIKETLDSYFHYVSESKNIRDAIEKPEIKSNTSLRMMRHSLKEKGVPEKVWNLLRHYVGELYPGALDHIMQKHTSLTPKDLNFISMLVCDYPYSVIAATLDYSNENYIKTKVSRLKKRLGAETGIKTYFKEISTTPHRKTEQNTSDDC